MWKDERKREREREWGTSSLSCAKCVWAGPVSSQSFYESSDVVNYGPIMCCMCGPTCPHLRTSQPWNLRILKSLTIYKFKK